MSEFEFTEVLTPEQIALFQLCLTLTTLERLGFSLSHSDAVYLSNHELSHELITTESDDGVIRWGYRTREDEA